MNISKLPSHYTQSIRKTVSWRLNQELLGRVVRSNSQSRLHIEIEGKNYSLQSNTFPEPGKLVRVKVVSLSPGLEFEFIDIFRNRGKPEADPATVLSAELLPKIRQDNNVNTSNMFYFLKSLGHFALQSIPVEAMSLLNTLKKKLIKSKDLPEAGKLKHALRHSGLLLESKLASLDNRRTAVPLEFEADLKAILLRLFESLDGKSPPNRRGKMPNGSPAEYSFSVYRDNEKKHGDVQIQLKQKVEEELSSITLKQKSTLKELGKGNQCWFFELLVNFPSRPMSIPVTIYRDGSEGTELRNQSHWGAEFSLELENSGFIHVQIKLFDLSVSVSLRSELRKTAEFLNRHCDMLRNRLNACGLTLGEFNSDQLIAGRPDV